MYKKYFIEETVEMVSVKMAGDTCTFENLYQCKTIYRKFIGNSVRIELPVGTFLTRSCSCSSTTRM